MVKYNKVKRTTSEIVKRKLLIARIKWQIMNEMKELTADNIKTLATNYVGDEQNNLLDALKAKYETEYPEVFTSITEEQLSLLTTESIIDIKLNCKAVDPEPEWKFYKKNGTINSSEFYFLAVEESEQLRKKKLEKTDTTGF